MKLKVDFNLIWMDVFNQQLDDLIKHLDCWQDFYQSELKLILSFGLDFKLSFLKFGSNL